MPRESAGVDSGLSIRAEGIDTPTRRQYGRVAQLGAQLLCTEKVGGSSPLTSTKGRLDHCFQIMSGGLVATDLNQVMPLGLIRDCLRFAGERALSRSSRQGR